MGLIDLLAVGRSRGAAVHHECRNCGTNVAAGVRVCPECGGDVAVHTL